MDKEREREIAWWRQKKIFCVCVYVCVCVAHMQVSVESNGVCVTLVMQVSGNTEMSVVCMEAGEAWSSLVH